MSKVVKSKTLLDILNDTASEIAAYKKSESVAELKCRIKDAPSVESFYSSLAKAGVGLIAEIKECSPSKGAMNPENVKAAAEVYKNSPLVRAISVLTSRTNFGTSMTLEHLLDVKVKTGKPVLRKDFIIDDYQVYQARAYGADAILLMANILKQQELKRLYNLATDLGMDVLFETHVPSEIKKIPQSAKIYGINSRMFCSDRQFMFSRWMNCFSFLRVQKDLTTDLSRFNYCDQLPATAIRIAESGVAPAQCVEVLEMGFNAILVGTSLLLSKEPIANSLKKFEHELNRFQGYSDCVPFGNLQPAHA